MLISLLKNALYLLNGLDSIQMGTLRETLNDLLNEACEVEQKSQELIISDYERENQNEDVALEERIENTREISYRIVHLDFSSLLSRENQVYFQL